MTVPVPAASKPHEVEQVSEWIRKQTPRDVYLEIGGYLGGSIKAYGSCMSPGATLISVDKPTAKPKARAGGVLVDAAKAMNGQDGFDTFVILGDSHTAEIRNQVSAILGNRMVDVLFIDGDHTKEGVNADSDDYVPFVRPGGLVVFHDVGPCEWVTKNAETSPHWDIFPAWQKLAQQHPRKALIQEFAGYGAVWIGE